MEQIIKRGGALGATDIVIGMPHRGRLNILANVMQKPYRAIFHEFQGGSFKPDDVGGSGDVSTIWARLRPGVRRDKVHLSLTANPSHLEAVNPVVLGKVRAKQAQLGDHERKQVIPVLLHGDAAFAGQGVVTESLGLSGLVGHRTGGSIHIIVNNQIGFTTAPHFSRSSPYSSDVALMVEAPISTGTATTRRRWCMRPRSPPSSVSSSRRTWCWTSFCYRRFGHNEGDEPMFTQPQMYKRIKAQKTTLQLYGGAADGGRPGRIRRGRGDEGGLPGQDGRRVRGRARLAAQSGGLAGRPLVRARDRRRAVSARRDRRVAGTAARDRPGADHGAERHDAAQDRWRIIDQKSKMFETGQGFDWATGEALAFGSLMQDGYGCASRDRTACAAPSPSATPPSSIRCLKPATCRCSTSRTPRRISR